jgi:hypothetical protein
MRLHIFRQPDASAGDPGAKALRRYYWLIAKMD